MQRDGATRAGLGTHDRQAQPVERIALRRGEGFQVGGITVVGGDQLARAFDAETQAVAGGRRRASIAI